MDTKITIIEGPPPVFEAVEEGWVSGLSEGLTMAEVALTRLRTFNGPALVERCHRAWRQHQTMNLEFRTHEGLTQEVPIVAIRLVRADEGDVVVLWLRIRNEDVELELGYGDDFGEDDEEGDYTFPDDMV